MAFRHMSRNETLGDPATHFFKSGGVLRAQDNKDLQEIVSMFPAHKIEYDIWYSSDDPDKVHGFVYTDVANKLVYIRVADKQRCIDIMEDAVQTKVTAEGERIFSDLAEGSDKYMSRQPREKHDFVIFLPGGNIFNRVVDRGKLHDAVRNGAKLKLHPLSAQALQAHLIKAFGEDALIDRKVSAHALLQNARMVGAFTNSEMGLVALAQGKTVYMFNDMERMSTYTAIYRAISDNGQLSADKLRGILSCKTAGLVSPLADDPQAYISGFFNRFEGQHV